MAKEYYFISDLHIGGDGALDICDFEDELLVFLDSLSKKNKNTELIVVGDVFGMWELTTVSGPKKLEYIINSHKKIFNQFKKTGKKIKITIIPGNHDHELACYKNQSEILKLYNINLEAKEYIIREIGGRKIWIEHGCQHDEYNNILEFGNPYANPIGYYTTSKIIASASRHSDFGKGNWLKDIEGVYPKEHVANWLYSNYYYKEMNRWLRLALLPFFIFFGVSILVSLFYLSDMLGWTNAHFFIKNILSYLWFFGNIIEIVLTVNTAVLTLLILALPALYLLYRDIKNTLMRYEIFTKEILKIQKEERYIEAAKEVFRNNKDISIFIYGHTHKADINKKGDQIIINTGAWLKKLKRINSRFRLLPDVYYPSFELSYFRIFQENDQVIISYDEIKKEIKPDLTWLQKFVILGRDKSDRNIEPQKIFI